MHLTISSILTACILDSLMILIFGFVVRKSSMIRRVGPECGILILVCMVIRMLFPVELWCTYSLRVRHVLPAVRTVLTYELVQRPHIVRIWDVLMGLWAAGAIWKLGRGFYLYRRMKQLFRLFPSKSLGDFLRERGLYGLVDDADEKISVAVTELVKTPCLFGLKNEWILLPEDNYTGEELSYIIRHEIMHQKRRDVLRKISIDILCTVFWWNPVFRYLKKTVFHMIEISNDLVLTEGMSNREKVAYMECLRNVAARIRKQEIPFGVTFSKSSSGELRQRLCLIGEKTGHQSRLRKGMVLLSIAMLCLSFLIILEPVTDAPEGTPMTKENTYLIQNGETYDVYFEGEYCFSTDDLRPFRGVTIYESKEEIETDKYR